MALTPLMLSELLHRLKPGDSIASMGYPDIIPSPELLELLADRDIQYRVDSAAICRRHGLKPQPIPDAESVFESLGASLDVYDIVNERGCEIVLDLNYPYPANSRGQYDLVLDVGTLEHCFNVAQALQNVAAMVKVGGYVLHENPFNCGNHGFYGFCPTWFYDFYTDNGFEIEDQRLVNRQGAWVNAPRTKRFQFTEGEANVFTIAKRLEARDFVFPVQTKYRK